MPQETNSKTHNSARPVQNRRRHARHPFTATIEAVECTSQTRIQGRTSDLSGGGCYVDTISSFPAGSNVKIRLTKETYSFETQAQVVYSLVGMGMGLKFTGTTPGQQRTVEKWLAEISGGRVPEPAAPVLSNPSYAPGNPGNEENEVLNELVVLLKRQGLLSDAKCEAMLAKLMRARHAKLNSSAI